jgi:uncharacterized protein (TIGR03067 family)
MKKWKGSVKMLDEGRGLGTIRIETRRRRQTGRKVRRRRPCDRRSPPVKRFVLLAALAAVPATPLASADDAGPRRDAADGAVCLSDLGRIQGTWVLAAVEEDGVEGTEGKWFASFSRGKWTYRGDYLTTDSDTEAKILVVLDLDKRPATYTLIYNEGKGLVEPSLYEFRGDTLRICLYPTSNECPREFNSKDGRIILIKVRDRTGGR